MTPIFELQKQVLRFLYMILTQILEISILVNKYSLNYDSDSANLESSQQYFHINMTQIYKMWNRVKITCFKYDLNSVTTKASQLYLLLVWLKFYKYKIKSKSWTIMNPNVQKKKKETLLIKVPLFVYHFILFFFSRKTFVQPCHTFQPLHRLFIKLSFLHSPGPVSAKCRRYIDSRLSIQIQ